MQVKVQGKKKALQLAQKGELNIKKRWSDVVIWESFWEEMTTLMLASVGRAWMSGYRAGKKEKRGTR